MVTAGQMTSQELVEQMRRAQTMDELITSARALFLQDEDMSEDRFLLYFMLSADALRGRLLHDIDTKAGNFLHAELGLQEVTTC